MSALRRAWLPLPTMKAVRNYSPRELRDMRVVDVIGKALEGELSWLDVARILGYSARHVRRIRERLEVDGPASLLDRRAGRDMPKRVAPKTQRKILKLRRERYFDFNVKHFHEQLTEKHDVEVSYTYTKMLLQQSGLADVGRARGQHRKRRERRPMRGMMLHMDGSKHAWLGREHGERDLIAVLDDASGELLYAHFVPEEDTRTCLHGIQEVVRRHGLFAELYVDRGSHFGRTAVAGGPVTEEGVQFARVMRKLKVTTIYARSPQARWRSERAFGTIQNRLPQELRAAGIADWDAANVYLEEVFRPAFNKRFGVAPESPESAFVKASEFDVERACALEHDVSVGGDNVVRWRRRDWVVPRQPSRPTYARCKARLVEYLDGRVDLEYGERTIARFDATGKPLPLAPTAGSVQGRAVDGAAADGVHGRPMDSRCAPVHKPAHSRLGQAALVHKPLGKRSVFHTAHSGTTTTRGTPKNNKTAQGKSPSATRKSGHL